MGQPRGVAPTEARVRIPEESQTRLPVILTSDGFGELPVRLRPAVEPYLLEVPPPVLGRVTADRIARKSEYMELAGNSRFQELLVNSRLFPGTTDFKDFV